MPGEWIKKQQVELYMKTRQQGHSQARASAKASICERSGRAIEHGKRVDPRMKERHWKTRSDPFESVWNNELKPMLEANPKLQALTLLEYLQDKYQEDYPDKLERTL